MSRIDPRIIRILLLTVTVQCCLFLAAAPQDAARQLSPEGDYADFPALAASPQGDMFAAWISYDLKGADQVRLRRFSAGAWQDPVTVTPEAGDYFKVALAVEPKGRLWVSWAARVDDNYDLFARTWDNGKWSDVTRLTNDPRPDFHHRMVVDSEGNIYLCWQSFRTGDSNIYLKVFEGARWSGDIPISTHEAGEWEPALALDGQNRLHIAYDTYRHGDYDVFLRVYDHGKLSQEYPVAATKKFEARASIACDREGRAWVAWDEQRENWALDRPFWELQSSSGDWGPAPAWSNDNNVSKMVSLRFSQRVGVAVFQNGRVRVPEARLDDALPPEMATSFEVPQLAVDGLGVPRMFFRRWVTRDAKQSDTSRPGAWNIWMSSYNGDRWAPPVKLQNSAGSNDQRLACAVDAGGRLWIAYPADDRLDQAGVIKNAEQRHGRIYLAVTDPSAAVQPALAEMEAPAGRPYVRTAPSDRRNTLDSDGKRLQLYWGDLHRHTEISGDGGYDGTVWDLYRYAFDVAELDFIAVTDHYYGDVGKDSDGRHYDWWRTQKLTDLFRVTDRFTPLFGYERSLKFPYGHRNVISSRRGITAFPSTLAGAEKGKRQPDELKLWDAVRGRNTITIPHTIATGAGTDWSYNDPVLEPVMEIYQGCRMSYEAPGAPRVSPRGNNKQGYAWSALEKGYKVGFIASSDHRSTHISYAAVYAEEPTREGILQGLQRRHTYAATDNIVMDVRLGDAILGDETTVDRPPVLRVSARGTAPIHEIQIIRNNTYVYSIRPDRREAAFTFHDAEARPGNQYYYYVRLQQQDGQMAWVSPIWVNYR